MKVLEKGHVYELTTRVPDNAVGQSHAPEKLTFINKEPGREHSGTTTQEVIRVLIDRTRHCNNCLPHPNNERVIYHLRMALALHEARAIERKVAQGDMIEYLVVGDDGHFAIKGHAPDPQELDTVRLEPYEQDWERKCNHPPAPELPASHPTFYPPKAETPHE